MLCYLSSVENVNNLSAETTENNIIMTMNMVIQSQIMTLYTTCQVCVSSIQLNRKAVHNYNKTASYCFYYYEVIIMFIQPHTPNKNLGLSLPKLSCCIHRLTGRNGAVKMSNLFYTYRILGWFPSVIILLIFLDFFHNFICLFAKSHVKFVCPFQRKNLPLCLCSGFKLAAVLCK